MRTFGSKTQTLSSSINTMIDKKIQDSTKKQYKLHNQFAKGKIIYIKDYGIDEVAIQNAIDGSSDYDTIMFDGVVYEINSTVHFKARRQYLGKGKGLTILKQMSDYGTFGIELTCDTGTTTTTIVTTNPHNLHIDDVIFNDDRSVSRKVLTITDEYTFTVSAVTSQTTGDTIYKDWDYIGIIDRVGDGEAETYTSGGNVFHNPVKDVVFDGLYFFGFRDTTSDEDTAIAGLATNEFSPFNEIASGTNTGYTPVNLIEYNNGLKLMYVQDSFFINCAVRFCGRDGILLTGRDSTPTANPYNQTTATNFFFNFWVYGNDRYGVFFDIASQDNHFIGCDFGYNQYENVWFNSGSNSINTTPVWGSREANGILIGSSSNQVRNCQVEGNAQHGIKITEYGNNILISGNKIYYNSTQTDDSYDGIYIQGASGNNCKNIAIMCNFIYSGLYFGVSVNKQRRSITLDTYHEDCHISGNAFQYSGQDGDLNLDDCIYGITTGDTLDNVPFITSSTRPSTAITSNIVGRLFYETNTANIKRYSTWNSRWETVLTSPDKPQGGNSYAVASTLTSATVTFTTAMTNTSYSIVIEPQWATTFYITAKSTTAFTVTFGTASPGSTINWGVIPHSY